MAKNKFKINADTIDLAFQNITRHLQDKQWWDDEKSRQKAVKIYKKLKLEKLFNLAKQDFQKYSKKIQNSLNVWCHRCINNKQWKKLKNSIVQAQQKLNTHLETPVIDKDKIPEREKTISLSSAAYKLLQNISKNKNKSVSEIIMSSLVPKIESKTNDSKNNQSIKTMDAIKNTQPDIRDLKVHEKKKKGGLNAIELWHYAGGQCQALSKVTKKRCKRITPELSIKHQIINNIDYEYAVCHTHNNDKSELDQSDINVTP